MTRQTAGPNGLNFFFGSLGVTKALKIDFFSRATHNLTLGSSHFNSFRSSLQFHSLWVTLYTVIPFIIKP